MIDCPECKKVMEHQRTKKIGGVGPGEISYYYCSACKCRAVSELMFEFEVDEHGKTSPKLTGEQS